MTLDELAKKLEERGATLMLVPSSPEWFVSLYAGDDPAAAFFVEVGDTLEGAVATVLAAWDKADREMGENQKSSAEVQVEITDDD